MQTDMVDCADCGRQYNAAKLRQCPACSSQRQRATPSAQNSSGLEIAQVRVTGGISDDLARKILGELEKQTSIQRTIKTAVVSISAAIGIVFLVLAIATWG